MQVYFQLDIAGDLLSYLGLHFPIPVQDRLLLTQSKEEEIDHLFRRIKVIHRRWPVADAEKWNMLSRT